MTFRKRKASNAIKSSNILAHRHKTSGKAETLAMGLTRQEQKAQDNMARSASSIQQRTFEK
jgi:hypothetical protein